MLHYVVLGRYRKSQLASKILLTLTVAALLPLTDILVVQGQSRDIRPGSACQPPSGAGSCYPTLDVPRSSRQMALGRRPVSVNHGRMRRR